MSQLIPSRNQATPPNKGGFFCLDDSPTAVGDFFWPKFINLLVGGENYKYLQIR